MVKGRRYMSAGVAKSGVLGGGGFLSGVGAGARVAKLHFGSEERGASADAPRHQRLLDLARTDRLADPVFFYATHLRTIGKIG